MTLENRGTLQHLGAMALPAVFPDQSNFLGVALVVNRNRDGPRFVFHYPSRIPSPQESRRKEFSVDYLDDDDAQAESTASASPLGGLRDLMPRAGDLARWNHDDHLVNDNGTHIAPWEYVAGLPTKALAGILTPPRAFHKKRFQISLDSVTYLAYPVHVPVSGFWGREKNRRGGRTRGAEDGSSRENNETDDKEDKASSMTMFSLVFIMNPKRHDANQLLDVMYTHVVREVNKVYKYCQENGDFVWQECKKILLLKDRARENRTKMSVLWGEILAASSLAASIRDVYEDIRRNRIAALELNLEKGSVGHSVQIPIPFYINDLQPPGVDIGRSLWLTTANTMSRFEALGGLSAFDKCFALLLTDDDDKNIITELQARGDKSAAAMIDLVKVSKPTLSFHQIAQLPDTMLGIEQIRAYAQHFIYWRRAMAVPPIHARDVYVLSPNCDIGSLASASASFSRAFPFAPPLPDLLAGLSAAPRPYKSFCPSKSLRPAYLRILAWLIRGGWVCQICTFAYVVVWPEIQYEVEYNLEAEDLARIKHRHERASTRVHQSREEPTNGRKPGQPQQKGWRSRDGHSDLSGDAGDDSGDGTGGDVSSDSALNAKGDDSFDAVAGTGAASDADVNMVTKTDGTSLASGYDLSMQHSSSKLDREKHESGTDSPRPSAAEHAAERARRQRIAEKAAHNLAERATAHARKPAPAHTEHPSVNGAAHLAGILPHIILDASRPTGRESLYLSAIERHLRARHTKPPPASKREGNVRLGKSHGRGDETATWNDRVGEMWPEFWKYFDGRTSLETIALLQDMKRKDVWNILSAMSEFLLCVRHW